MSGEYIKNIVLNFCLFKTHNTNKTCDKAISGNVGTLKSLPDWCKSQEMCNNEVDNYSRTLELASECLTTQKCVIKLSILIHLQ